MLNAGLSNCWNETQNTKKYTVAWTLNVFPTPVSLVKMRHETKGYWNIIKVFARCDKKSGLDEVPKSKALNEASLQSKEFHVIKCLRINLNYNPSNISGKLIKYSKETRSNRIEITY